MMQSNYSLVHPVAYNWAPKATLTGASRSVAVVEHLHEGAERNTAPTAGPRGTEDMDPNCYLEALRRLRLPDGYCLDYYYWKTVSSGAPSIYAREASRPPCVEREDLMKANGYFDPLELLIPDGSFDSWFELEIFRRVAGQFRLSWHAKYHDFQFVANSQRLEQIVMTHAYRMKPDFVHQAKRLETSVLVTKSDTSVTLEYLGFSKWSGFTRFQVTIDKRAPFEEIESKKTQHLEWHCGVRF